MEYLKVNLTQRTSNLSGAIKIIFSFKTILLYTYRRRILPQSSSNDLLHTQNPNTGYRTSLIYFTSFFLFSHPQISFQGIVLEIISDHDLVIESSGHPCKNPHEAPSGHRVCKAHFFPGPNERLGRSLGLSLERLGITNKVTPGATKVCRTLNPLV